MMLMSALKNIIEESQTSLRPGSSAPDCNNVPLLLCGDLNSLPDSGELRVILLYFYVIWTTSLRTVN